MTTKKYIFFLNLKNAYESVHHCQLFEKMERIGASERLINTAKMYSSTKMIKNPLMRQMNMNRGVLQGSVLSPY